MTDFFYQFILPVLATLSIVFIVLSALAIRRYRNDADHDRHTTEGFDYTKNALQSVDQKLVALQGNIDTALLPKLKGVYDAIVESGLKMEPDTLLSFIKSIGFEGAEFLTKSHHTIWNGGILEERKTSIVWQLSKSKINLTIVVFNSWIDKPPETLLSRFLEMNGLLSIGKINLNSFQEKYVPAVEYNFVCQSGFVDRDSLKTVVFFLLNLISEVNREIASSGAVMHELLVKEFMSLITNPSLTTASSKN